MSHLHDADGAGPQDARQITKWTVRYAQNRTIPVLVSLLANMALFVAIFGGSCLAGMAYRTGQVLWFWILIVFLVGVCMPALVFLSVPKWGGRFIVRISMRLYGREGSTTLPAPQRVGGHRWVPFVAGGLFGICVQAEVILGLLGYFPVEYMQPISALYMVPFLVFLSLWMRPIVSLLSLLWPALYALHAILVVAGVPIQFTSGPGQALNMLIPVFGYGILGGLAVHMYSRFALRKLKRLAATAGGGTSPIESGPSTGGGGGELESEAGR